MNEGTRRRSAQKLNKFKRLWVYIPGISIAALGLTVAIFPQALSLVVGCLLIVAGVAITQAIRAIRHHMQWLQTRVEIYTSEMRDDFSEDWTPGPRENTTWVN